MKELPDPVLIKKLKEKISQNESRLQKLMAESKNIWEETGLDPKDSSYLVEKTMRFEIAQKNISVIFSSFSDLIENYKSLCQELEKIEE
ncbi:MAG: hypothetical protein KGH99_02210 [Thaumarchaeota archaeon]|nr:hypothetical protein [Nitrososphaerota archaeon]MDE1872273.1 hypothetical protein [Nitrososphaerota archaeon]